MSNTFLNGRYMPSADAFLNIEDRGTLFGDGVYEYVSVYNGKLFLAEEHLDRLWYSASEVEIPIPYSREEILGILEELVRQNGADESGIYIELTRGTAARVHHFPENIEPNFFATIREHEPIPPAVYAEGVSMALLPDERWKRCDIKTVNLLPNVLAKQKARKSGFYDAILFSERGVTESTSSTVLAVFGGVIVTAPLGPWILPGVTREKVLELAAQAGIEVQERFFTPQEFLAADEVMLTGTRTGITPVTRVDMKLVGTGVPGPVFGRLSGLFNGLLHAR